VSSPGQLEGKIALVTGSSRGIGRVIASYLAELGAEVGVHGTTPTSLKLSARRNHLTLWPERSRRSPTEGSFRCMETSLFQGMSERSRRGSVIHLARLTYSSTVLAVISVWRGLPASTPGSPHTMMLSLSRTKTFERCWTATCFRVYWPAAKSPPP